jgi:fatty-acid desaturase
MILMSHAEHGFHHAYTEAEVESNKKHGWAVYVGPVELNDEAVRQAYFEKFGKNPHHLMKMETIRKAVDDNRE